jgi:hypothetical protein
MRPIRRGSSPIAAEYQDYKKAKPDLVARLGLYCSFCERRIPTNMAVEHIQPKGLAAHAHLIGRWDNFLLACVNCNSTKKDKDVNMANVLLPDRDNTFAALHYLCDGSIQASPLAIAAGLDQMVTDTLALTGLDAAAQNSPDANSRQIALDRVSQRMETWLVAIESRDDLAAAPQNVALQSQIVKTATACGFFSIWMTVFQSNSTMLNSFIDAFDGTRASGCFAQITGLPVSPAPNPDGLPAGSKL